MKKIIIISLNLLLFITGCGSTTYNQSFPERTNVSLAGDLCDSDGFCNCDPSKAKNTISGNNRRFEIVMQDFPEISEAIVISKIGDIVVKSKQGEQYSDSYCFYVDLIPGEIYHVSYKVKSSSVEQGIKAGFKISEINEKGIYNVFEQTCGGKNSPCSYRSSSDWLKSLSIDKGWHDPCGGTKLLNIRVDGVVMDEVISEAELSFELVVTHEGAQNIPGASGCYQGI